MDDDQRNEDEQFVDSTKTNLGRTITDTDFDLDKYNKLKDDFVDSADSNGYGSDEIKKIIAKIHTSAADADVKGTENKYLKFAKQVMYSVVKPDAKKLIDKELQKIEELIQEDYSLIQKIERKRSDNAKSRERQIMTIDQIREEYDEKTMLIEGFSREIDDIDYILKSRAEGSAVDKSRLKAIKNDYAGRNDRELTSYRLNLKRRQDQVMFEITGLETEVIRVDNQIQQIDTARKSTEVLIAKKREEIIRKSRAISGKNSPKFIELFELALELAVNAEKNESEFRKYFSIVNATMGEANSNENVILYPYTVNLGKQSRVNDKSFNETLDEKLRNSAKFYDGNSTIAKSIMNKYLGTNYS